MNTQCPKCKTIFHVTPEILAVKEGLVRCGDCENVFNATWHFLDDVETPPESPVVADSEPAEDAEPASEAVPDDASATEPPAEKSPKPERPKAPPRPIVTTSQPATSTPKPVVEIEETTAEDLHENFFELPEDEDDAVILGKSSNTGLEEIAKNMSDEDIERALRLDEALNLEPAPVHHEATKPNAPDPKPAPTDPAPLRAPQINPAQDTPQPGNEKRRIEPQLGPLPEGGLRVDQGDRILANPHHRPSFDNHATGSKKLRKKKVLLRTPHHPSQQPHSTPEAMHPQQPVHWENMAGQASPGSRLLWASGVLLALILLLAQIRFTLVDELFSIPETRPFISLFCDFAGCEPPARTDPGLVHIARTRVDLHANVPGALTIKVNLINKAAFSQPYPPLQLTLTDKEGRIVGRRTYQPEEFLTGDPGDHLLDPGILTIATLHLAHPNESAVGFETTVAGH